MFSRFNHAVACIRTLFLLLDYNYSILCVYYILPSHVLMNIWVVSTFWQLWKMLQWILIYKYLFEILLFNSFRNTPRIRIARSYDNFKLDFLRTYQHIFYNTCIIWLPRQPCNKSSNFSHLCKHYYFSLL